MGIFNHIRESFKESIDAFKVGAADAHQMARGVLRDTSIEIVVGALIGLAVAGTISYDQQKKHEGRIPLGFSEISQIQKDQERKGLTVGPRTFFYALTNDTEMKVFESWNNANEGNVGWFRHNAFANRLDERMDKSMKFHKYELVDLLPQLPARADAMLESMREFWVLQGKLLSTVDKFDRAWKDKHDDFYRTEIYFEEVCTSNSNGGQTCHSEPRTRQVYDHTTHTYTYFPKWGTQASLELTILLREHGDIDQGEQLLRPSHTNADGEYGAWKSRDDKHKPGQGDYLSIATRWNSGSTLNKVMPIVYVNLNLLKQTDGDWRVAMRTAHNTSYDTGSHYDDGPVEFQVAERAMHAAQMGDRALEEVRDGVLHIKTAAPLLESQIKQYILAVTENGEGDKDKLSRNILQTSKTMYRMNFPGGFDVETFKWGPIVAWSLLGLAIGAGVGFGVDTLGKQYDWYDESEEERYSPHRTF
jgi:hypothetical protein